jgi:hypothetical protein
VERPPRSGRPVFSLPAYHGYVGCLQALGTLDNVELYALAFIQIAKAIALDRAVVDKDVVAFFPRDESITLGPIEPLDGSRYSLGHVLPLIDDVRRKVPELVLPQKKRPDS